jgi:hypothetical protein
MPETRMYGASRPESPGDHADRIETTMSANPENQAPPAGGFLRVLPYFLDVIVPLVSFYVLRAAGLSAFWSLVIGGALTAPISVINTIRRGKLDKLGVLVIAELVLGIVLDLTVRNARFTLARGSLFVALAGIWILASAFTSRPLTVDATKPFAAAKGGRSGIDAFEWLAGNSLRFLRIHRSICALWGVLLLAYAAVRVIIIYSVSISEAVWTTEFPGIIAIGICLIASRQAGKRLEALVNERMEHMSKDPA